MYYLGQKGCSSNNISHYTQAVLLNQQVELDSITMENDSSFALSVPNNEHGKKLSNL